MPRWLVRSRLLVALVLASCATTPMAPGAATQVSSDRLLAFQEKTDATSATLGGTRDQRFTITITSPAANASYQLNATVGARYTCSDSDSGVTSCQGTVADGSSIDTSSTGTKTFTVTFTDSDGNEATVSVFYNVVTGGGGETTSADVGITLSAPGSVDSGGTLAYTVTVTNGGKVTANGVVVSNPLPAGTLFASASTSQGTIAAPSVASNGTVAVNVGTLAKGSTATVSVVVTVSASPGAVLTNKATVTATTQDLNSSNNSATRKTNVKKPK
jgi:uncharacterized repeat protein (TIGR01451 family)